ncbi:hypothetical protein EIP91_010401 [Steccherinum ochraceum]|uniref:NADP-dependent oxidoreductase domain-containing protein n=1 Tax=Steccherinum ochraceum TaxID=92696 RepID=A0A4V2MUX7_9APHY|nr:hypothetical protein EIP91_010401 [Steccherinum ochraceum]
MSTERKHNMQYVRLGNSGLKVSKIILGTMQYGHPGYQGWQLGEEEAIKHIKFAYESGIQTFDTANAYSNGLSEIILGRAIKQLNLPREELVIMTKVYMPLAKEYDVNLYALPGKPDEMGLVNQHGLSRKNIFASVKASLERLQLDYIDLYQCHRFDYDTPIEETMQALHDVVQAGYVRYIGMSSCYAYQFHQMQNYALTHGLTPFVSMQNNYSLLYREEEREMFPTLKMFGVGSIPYSPLARGLLSRPLDEHSVRSETDWFLNTLKSPSTATIVARVASLASTKSVSMAQIALAWVLSRPGVVAPVVGMSSVEKMRDTLGALDVVLTEEERVGRVWRKHGGVGAVELGEDEDGQAYVQPPALFRFSGGTQSTPVSPRSSATRLTGEPEPTPSARPRSGLMSSLNRSRRSLLPTVDPSQRPFDAIVNFLPKNTSDKALLKQSILVTTISRPFLMAANGGNSSNTSPRPANNKRRSFFGSASRSTTSVYLPPTPPYASSGESLNAILPMLPAKAHLIHLLPRESRSFGASARSKLVQSLESFLISFAYPASLSHPHSHSMERARPYLMPVAQLGAPVCLPSSSPSTNPYEAEARTYTLVDLVLGGSLDGFDSPNANPGKLQPLNATTRLTPRAWISGPGDVVVLTEDSPLPGAGNGNIPDAPSVTFTPPSPDALSPPSTSPVARPPRSPARGAVRPALQQSAADSSFSSVFSSSSTSASTSTSTSASTSPVPTSPLANEYISPPLDGEDDVDEQEKLSPHILNALPTPPDSDESGSDSNGQSQRTLSVKLGWGRKRAVSMSEKCGHGVVEVAELGAKASVRNLRWRFWRAVK